MTTTPPARDRKKEFVSFLADVEGTQRLFQDYEAEDRKAQKDGLLGKLQTKAYSFARSQNLPNLPAQASGVALDDAKNYLGAKAQLDSQYASGVLTEQGGLEELVGGIAPDKLEQLAFGTDDKGNRLLKHSDKAYQKWSDVYASLQGQKKAYEAFAERVKTKKVTSEDEPLVKQMMEKAASVKAQERMAVLKQEGRLSHDRIELIGKLVAEAVQRGAYGDVIADGVKATLGALDTQYKAHIEAGAQAGQTLRGYVEGAMRPLIGGKTEDFNRARSYLYGSLK